MHTADIFHKFAVRSAAAMGSTWNREGQAVQIKLDQLIRAVDGARNKILNLAALSEEELLHWQQEFKNICIRHEGSS